mmetsp:Transcript_30130/g.30492  ORF Transcript_30130/g.30492 Transcript_30130/m.30492 type:complete len:81 (+) Transcript_30130:90-332(+)
MGQKQNDSKSLLFFLVNRFFSIYISHTYSFHKIVSLRNAKQKYTTCFTENQMGETTNSAVIFRVFQQKNTLPAFMFNNPS